MGQRETAGADGTEPRASPVYGLVHSALPSRQAKEAAARLLGHHHRNGLYRALYNAQAIVTFAAFLRYIARLPDRVLHHARGPLALAMRLGQAAALGYAVAAAWTVGPGGITGLASLIPVTNSADGAEAARAQDPQNVSEHL